MLLFIADVFERFDPTNDDLLPANSRFFDSLTRIIWPAVRVVGSHLERDPTPGDLAKIAKVAEERIAEFFAIEAEATHGALTDEEEGLIQFGDANPDNTTMLEALTERLEPFETTHVEGMGEVPAHVVYAVLCLYHAGSALDHLAEERQPRVSPEQAALRREPRFTHRPRIWHRTEAAIDLILAMEALSEAEQAQFATELEESLGLGPDTAETVSEPSNEAAAKMARAMISVAAKNAAAKRHEENRAMRAQVFEWCDKNLDGFNSMDSAAEAIAGKLVPVKFRTARSWIAAYRRGLRAD